MQPRKSFSSPRKWFTPILADRYGFAQPRSLALWVLQSIKPKPKRSSPRKWFTPILADRYGLAPLETQKAALSSGLPQSWLTGMVLLNHKAWLYGFYKP